MPAGPVQSWSVANVAEWLTELELPHSLTSAFQENAVDLATLTDADLVDELQCSKLQARKIRNALTALGVAPPAAPAAPAAPAPAVPAPAPVAAAPVAPAPAAAPAAAVDRATGEPDPRACFNPSDLDRYRQLSQQITELQALQIPAKAEQARRFAGQARQQLEGAKRAIPPARQAVGEAQEEYAKYAEDKWYPGKALAGKEKKQTLLDESKAVLDAATRRLAQAEQQAADGAAQLAEAEKQLGAWRSKESELTTAQRTREELVVRMFAAPAWGASRRQCELVDAARALEGQAAEAHRGVDTYGRGTQLLVGAAKKLEGAIKALQGTQMLNMMGMGPQMMRAGMTGRPGMMQPNVMQNVAEMAILRKANDAVMSAAQDTEQARQLLGAGLPQVNPEIMKAARAGIFANVIFGGMMSDMMQMAAVAKSVKAVEQLLGEVRQAASWAQSNLAVYQHKHAGLQAQVAGKRGELEAFRGQSLQAALEASAPAAVQPPRIEQLSLI